MNTSAQKDTRQHILAVGYQLVTQKGFSAVGLSQLLQQAGVPKGSFYHYFASKEQFGKALIEDYFSMYYTRLDQLFNPALGSGRERLLSYWQQWQQTQQAGCFDQRCLVVKLTAEVADLSEQMRLALLAGYQQVIRRIAECIRSGQADGSISPSLDADQQARALYYLWLGASLADKLSQDSQPLQIAMQQTLALLG